MRKLIYLGLLAGAMIVTMGAGTRPSGKTEASRQKGVAAFATVAEVFQHPRCRNCHIEGDAPLQGDDSVVHTQNVVRGPRGFGPPGQPCSTCHAEANPPASYGPEAPPGAPNWMLPAPHEKMAWMDVSAAELCALLHDPHHTGGRDLDALLAHVREDPLVLWGWQPGGDRAPVSVPHAEFVARFATWVAAGGPCPEPGGSDHGGE